MFAGLGLVMTADSLATIWIASGIGALGAVAVCGLAGLLGAGLFSIRLVVLRSQIRERMARGVSGDAEIEQFAGVFILTALAALPGLASSCLAVVLYPPILSRYVGKIILAGEGSSLELLRQHLAGE